MEKPCEMKRQVNKVMKGVFLYGLIIMGIIMLDITIQIVRVCVSYRGNVNIDQQIDAVINQCMDSGTSSLISIVVGVLFLCFYYRKQGFAKNICSMGRKMTVPAFFMILTVFMSAHAMFLVLGTAAEAGLNHFGYSIMGEIESASSTSKMFTMFLYASVFGPITEELVFRGFVLRGFERFGRIAAILGSAVVFGAFHGNLIQGIFASAVGLVLGYVAIEYSIFWSMLIHIINNLVFVDLWAFLTGGLSEAVQKVLLNSVQGTFFVCAVGVLFLKRKEIKAYWVENQSKKIYAKAMVTAFWMIAFMIVQLAFGIMGITTI